MTSQLAKLTSSQTETMEKFAVRGPPDNEDSIKSKGLPVLGLWPTEASLVRKLALEVRICILISARNGLELG